MSKNINKIKKAFISSCIACLVLAAGVTTVHAAGRTLAGADRYDTAAKVAEAGWTTSTVAILAPGENIHLVDALAAAPLAKAYKAPILLTESNTSTLNSFTVSELKALGVTDVYIVSGVINKDKISPALKDAGVKNIYQLGGINRYVTAYNIANQVAAKNGKVNGIMVVGYNGTPDALSASSIAAGKGYPIFFADSSVNSLPQSVSNFISAKNVSTKYVLGGKGVVGDSVVSKLGASTTTRLGGLTRYETSAAILNQFKADYDLSNVFVASGDNAHIVDALSISALASQGANANPVVIATTDISGIPATVNFLKTNLTSTSNIQVLGGPTVVSTSLEGGINALSKITKIYVQPGPAITTFDRYVEVTVYTTNPTGTTVSFGGTTLTYKAEVGAFVGVVPVPTADDSIPADKAKYIVTLAAN